ncbi:Uncharacterised protein [BD1-7 clade bacterium]|uniref:Uncharacterized protein n=1 Tax=BD1-7 clade bacterium TaxID=2029982 RepID=A0A5S9N624_9GAMM|nr:Uncharacterised protein [BD1-7 clade bacterium]
MKGYLLVIFPILLLYGCNDNDEKGNSRQILNGSQLVGQWKNKHFPTADSYTINIDEKGVYSGVVIGDSRLLLGHCDGLDLDSKYKLALPAYQISQLTENSFTITPKNGIDVLVTNIENDVFSCNYTLPLVSANSIDVQYQLVGTGDELTLTQLGQKTSYEKLE